MNQKENKLSNLKRKYIPALWTNFQIENWFPFKKGIMQNSLDEWVKNNPSDDGYFTVVQYDDGPLLRLPYNTIVYGACSGDIPIPLIYEDKNNTLINMNKKKFNEKKLAEKYVSNNWNTLLPIAQYFESTGDDKSFESAYKNEAKPVFEHKVSEMKTSSLDIIRATPYGNTLTLEIGRAHV